MFPPSVFRPFLIVALLLGSLAPARAGELVETFQAAVPGTPASEQAGWGRHVHGRAGGNVIASRETPDGVRPVLTAPGGGDYWNTWKPAPAAYAAATRGPVSSFSFRFLPAGNGAARIQVALAGVEGGPFLEGITLGLGRKFSLTVGEQRRDGLLTLATHHWHEAVFTLARSGDSGALHGTVAVRDLTAGETGFRIDPALDKYVFDGNGLKAVKAPVLAVRLDSGFSLGSIRLVSPAETPAASTASVAQIKPAYAPLLDHLAAPRQALDLDGVWETTATAVDAPPPPASGPAWQPVIVPDRHGDLMKSKTQRVWFKRRLTVGAIAPDTSYLLHFERVTDLCDVYVNGTRVGGSDDGWWPFTVNASPALRAGENELLVGVLSPSTAKAVGNRPVGWGWYLPLYAGIPFPVHLEISHAVHISDVLVEPALAGGSRLRTTVTVRNDSTTDRRVTVEAAAGDAFRHRPAELVVPAQAEKSVTLEDAWASPHLWQPHDPFLYHLAVSLRSPQGPAAAPALDSFVQRFGFREIRVEGPRLVLNGRPFMHRRNSIICYWAFHDADKIRAMFGGLRERGYVGSRLHGPGNDRIARVADEMGWLLTVESGINEPRGDTMSDAFWPAAEQHAFSMVRHFRNHPSVIYWSLSNEFGSNYMPKGHPKARWVDAWLAQLGKKIMAFDPTRTVTFSGDIELGGRGHHGPAPTLSFHYPWQPVKPENMIPLTAYWLEEGKKPWQAVAWDRTKPVIFSEDLYQPYAFSPPHGMTQWAGEKPYDPALMPEALFSAYRMLAEGYYHSGLSAWNPWGTQEATADNPIYKLGQLMPDYLVATRETNRTFASGEQVKRTLYAYNQLFRDLDVVLTRELRVAGQPAVKTEARFPLTAGGLHEETVTLPLPKVARLTPVEWTLVLSESGGRELTRRTYAYTLFPESEPAADAGVVVIGPGIPGARTAPNLTEALAASPKALVLAGASLTRDELNALETRVTAGLRVLWLDAPPGSALPAPLKLDDGHKAAFAFLRQSAEPLLAGLGDGDLSLWRTDGLVVRNALFKPSKGVFDLLVDSGSPRGLSRAAILRLQRGRGGYLFCQMPVLAAAGTEPAARLLLARLLKSLQTAPEGPRAPVVLVADESSKLRPTLRMLGIPFVEAAQAAPGTGVWLVDGSAPASADSAARLKQHLAAQGRALVQRLTPESAPSWFAALGLRGQVEPVKTGQVVRRAASPLLDGLTNDDFYWVLNSKTPGPAILSHRLVLESETALVDPAGLAAPAAYGGRLLLSQLRWDELNINFPDRAGRIVRTLLRNQGASLGDGQVESRRHLPVKLAPVLNAAWIDEKTATGPAPRGWFRTQPDLTYFPVNRTGIDPVLGVPQPPEKFEPVLQSDEIAFQLVDPEKNQGRGALVIGPAAQGFAGEASFSPPAPRFTELWMAGAASAGLPANAAVAGVTFTYRDGETRTVELRLNHELGAFEHLSLVERARVVWTGSGGGKARVQLYAWPVLNPRPEADVTQVTLRSTSDSTALGVVAATVSAPEETKR